MEKEHEILKLMSDKIGYKSQYEYSQQHKKFVKPVLYNKSKMYEPYVDVREIIFTQEFMNKYREYYKTNVNDLKSAYNIDMLVLLNSHTGNPVGYLYNLIK